MPSRPVCVCYILSRVWLLATPWTVAHQAPLSTGFSRQEYWSGLLFSSPGDLPDPRIEPTTPAFTAMQADSLLLSHQGSQASYFLTCLNLVLLQWISSQSQRGNISESPLGDTAKTPSLPPPPTAGTPALDSGTRGWASRLGKSDMSFGYSSAFSYDLGQVTLHWNPQFL